MDVLDSPGALRSVAASLAALLAVGVAYATSRFCARVRLTRRFQRARRAEADALSLFAEHGYDVEATQYTQSWSVRCGPDMHSAVLRADFILRRGGKRYVADVKTGTDAARITNIATRRQLLEYRCAYAVDGVLLVDMERRQLLEVEFTGMTHAAARTRERTWSAAAWALLGAVLGSAVSASLLSLVH